MAAKLPTGEMLRLALWYAQQDREAYLDAIGDATGFEEDVEKTKAFIAQVKEYRIKRFGRNRGDDMEKHPTVNVMDLIAKDTIEFLDRKFRDGPSPT